MLISNWIKIGLLVVTASLHLFANATVLPEERADVLYHEYDGDGIKISGPSVLVRKNFLDKISVSANHYVDTITSASIDVRSFGSPYEEERTQQSIGVDLLNEKSIISFSYTNSSENDYEANTYYFGISQDFFGSMTNVSLGFAIGDDEIRATGNEELAEKMDRQNYRLSISQILTKKLIMGINIETVTEEGYLQNPYRKSRFIVGGSTQFRDEVYPRTKTSDAVSIRLKYHLPYRAAVHTEFRYYSDSWDIDARNIEFGYTHPLEEYPLSFEVKYRFYSQNEAEFFYDSIIGDQSPTEFHGRDKELSEYESTTYGVGVRWDFLPDGWGFLERASVSLNYDLIEFTYESFRDATQSDAGDGGDYVVGKEPFFEFDANVIRFFFTAVY